MDIIVIIDLTDLFNDEQPTVDKILLESMQDFASRVSKHYEKWNRPEDFRLMLDAIEMIDDYQVGNMDTESARSRFNALVRKWLDT